MEKTYPNVFAILPVCEMKGIQLQWHSFQMPKPFILCILSAEEVICSINRPNAVGRL